jgi:hypothetical protein
MSCLGDGLEIAGYLEARKPLLAAIPRWVTLFEAYAEVTLRTRRILAGNSWSGLCKKSINRLATVIPEIGALVGNTISRIFADKGYRGHIAPPDHKFRVFISGQKRGVTPMIGRQPAQA